MTHLKSSIFFIGCKNENKSEATSDSEIIEYEAMGQRFL